MSESSPVPETNEATEAEQYDLEIKRSTYEWSVRLFRVLQKVLKVNVKLHHSEGQIADGEIFLFNHFARFETFIPQYLIFREVGALSRSVASSEFFKNDDAFANYLLNAGAVPNDLANLLPFLAAEVLRGRKVIVFPEGGMVKDRRVVDGSGGYSVYSRKAEERRKHHTGAAVLGLSLDVFKQAVLTAHAAGSMRKLHRWADDLQLDGVDVLLAAANRPTQIVPANITFYPIRVGDNLLRKGAELLSRGLSRRLSEELLIEGNILLKHTDMDVRLGDAIGVRDYWRWFDGRLLRRLLPRVTSLDETFDLAPARFGWDKLLFRKRMRRNVLRLRDDYMHRMYLDVTVNLSHLASAAVLALLDAGNAEVNKTYLHTALYLAVKKVQRLVDVHPHRSLRDPLAYGSLLTSGNKGLEQFLRTTSNTELIEETAQSYRFSPKLTREHSFDEVRLENLVEVYANEVAPLGKVRGAIAESLDEAKALRPDVLARLRFDDQQIAWLWDKAKYSKDKHAEINRQQTAVLDPRPFLLEPQTPNGIGVVVAHGFLASPAEIRGFSQHLVNQGYTVVGVRLKGHGTSPWDLRDQRWQDWLASVRDGYEIASALVEQVALVGFSTGGALALLLAAERPAKLCSVAAVCVPMKFQNKNMLFVPLVHRANRVMRWMSSYEGIMPFRPNQTTENPSINYQHLPIRGLYELTQMVNELEQRLADLTAPVLLLQATRDPVVVPKSAEMILERLTTTDKTLEKIDADHHGILYRDTGATHSLVVEFLARIGEAVVSPRQR